MTTASSAVEKLLVKLNLDEFPCHFRNATNDDQDMFLQQLIKSEHSPWFQPNDWSDEIVSLKLRVIRSRPTRASPLTPQDIKGEFKSLFLRDQKIVTVDGGVRDFSNLEEINFTGNFLEEINLENLPPKVKNLVLCGNKISEIGAKSPNSIAHVALAYNKMRTLDFLSEPSVWNNLISLDLSSNLLAGLTPTMERLARLPRLKNLCLFHNPLSIARDYGTCARGMLDLIYFDDEIVSNESKNAARRSLRDVEVSDDFSLSLSLPHIRGLPQPREDPNICQTFAYMAAFCLGRNPLGIEAESGGPPLLLDDGFAVYSPKVQNWSPFVELRWSPVLTGTASEEIFHTLRDTPATLYIIEERTSYKKDQTGEAPKTKKGPPSPVGKKKDGRRKGAVQVVDTVERAAVASVEVPLRDITRSPLHFEFRCLPDVAQSDITKKPSKPKKGGKMEEKKAKLSKDKLNTVDKIEFDLCVTLNPDN